MPDIQQVWNYIFSLINGSNWNDQNDQSWLDFRYILELKLTRLTDVLLQATELDKNVVGNQTGWAPEGTSSEEQTP